MNVHFLPDSVYSQQFMDFISSNGLNEDNDFIIISNQKLKFISSDIKVISGSKFSMLKKIFDTVRKRNCNQIFVHFLSDIHLFPLLFARKSVKKYWIYWGADLYSFISYQLYDAETSLLLEENPNRKKNAKVFIWKLLRKKVIAKLDYIAINESEYPILINNFRTKAKSINLAYSSKEEVFSEHKSKKKNQEFTILLGNSGDPTNNHISMLKKLADIKKPFKVVVPLSYGSNKSYINKVVEIGRNLLADKFVPILDFMTSESYIELLSTVDVAIMNHYRQQAVGNIRILLNLGKTLFLRPENPLFEYYKRKGLQFKNIEELTEEELFGTLSEDDIETNLTVINQLYSNKNILELWKEYL